MGLRFRKSIKLGKGVKLNLSTKSVGLSVGGKGAHFSVNSKGRKSATFGIPGTGLSYTTSSSRKSKRKSSSNKNTSTSNVQTVTPKRQMKTGVVPLLVTVFLGWAGGHWFISGRMGMGYLYLFTFGLCGMGWIVDIIRQVCAFITMIREVETETYYADDNKEGQE